MKVRILFFTTMMLLLSTHIVAQNEIEINKKSPLTIEEKVKIQSNILNEQRVLNIYLPNGYSQDSLKKIFSYLSFRRLN